MPQPLIVHQSEFSFHDWFSCVTHLHRLVSKSTKVTGYNHVGKISSGISTPRIAQISIHVVSFGRVIVCNVRDAVAVVVVLATL